MCAVLLWPSVAGPRRKQTASTNPPLHFPYCVPQRPDPHCTHHRNAMIVHHSTINHTVPSNFKSHIADRHLSYNGLSGGMEVPHKTFLLLLTCGCRHWLTHHVRIMLCCRCDARGPATQMPTPQHTNDMRCLPLVRVDRHAVARHAAHPSLCTHAQQV